MLDLAIKLCENGYNKCLKRAFAVLLQNDTKGRDVYCNAAQVFATYHRIFQLMQEHPTFSHKAIRLYVHMEMRMEERKYKFSATQSSWEEERLQ